MRGPAARTFVSEKACALRERRSRVMTAGIRCPGDSASMEWTGASHYVGGDRVDPSFHASDLNVGFVRRASRGRSRDKLILRNVLSLQGHSLLESVAVLRPRGGRSADIGVLPHGPTNSSCMFSSRHD